jgi:hypothetical protein
MCRDKSSPRVIISGNVLNSWRNQLQHEGALRSSKRIHARDIPEEFFNTTTTTASLPPPQLRTRRRLDCTNDMDVHDHSEAPNNENTVTTHFREQLDFRFARRMQTSLRLSDDDDDDDDDDTNNNTDSYCSSSSQESNHSHQANLRVATQTPTFDLDAILNFIEEPLDTPPRIASFDRVFVSC